MSTKVYEEKNEDGGTNIYVVADGFRNRRVRGEYWLEEAIAEGLVDDPDNPTKVKRVPNPNDKIIEVPVATLGSLAHKIGVK